MMNISKEDYAKAINSGSVLKADGDLEALLAFFEFPKCCASASQLAAKVNFDATSQKVSTKVRLISERIAQQLCIKKLPPYTGKGPHRNGPHWWRIIANEKGIVGGQFIWELKDNLRSVLEEQKGVATVPSDTGSVAIQKGASSSKEKQRIPVTEKRETSGKLYTILKNNQLIQSPIPGEYAGWGKGKIFGRLDCKSGKRMKKKSRVFFHTLEDAVTQGFRPCKNCRPLNNDLFQTIRHLTPHETLQEFYNRDE